METGDNQVVRGEKIPQPKTQTTQVGIFYTNGWSEKKVQVTGVSLTKWHTHTHTHTYTHTRTHTHTHTHKQALSTTRPFGLSNHSSSHVTASRQNNGSQSCPRFRQVLSSTRAHHRHTRTHTHMYTNTHTCTQTHTRTQAHIHKHRHGEWLLFRPLLSSFQPRYTCTSHQQSMALAECIHSQNHTVTMSKQQQPSHNQQ